jgi:hypothetical protein
MDTITFIISMTLIYALAIITSQVNWKHELSDLIELFKEFTSDEI